MHSQFTQGSNDAAEVMGSFQKTAPRKTTEHTVKHRNGGVGSVVANRRDGSESSVVVTTLLNSWCSVHTWMYVLSDAKRTFTSPQLYPKGW